MPGTRSGSARRAPGVHRPCRAVGLATAPRRGSAACTWCRHTGPTPPSCFRAPPRALRRGLRELGCPARGLLCRCGPYVATPKVPVSPSASAAVPGHSLLPAPPLPLRPGTRRRETNRALGCGIPLPPRSRIPFYDWLQRTSRHSEAPPNPWPRLRRERPQREESNNQWEARALSARNPLRRDPAHKPRQILVWAGSLGPWDTSHEAPLFSVIGFHWTVWLSPSHFCLSLAGRPSLHLERRGQASAPEFVAGLLMACLHFPLASGPPSPAPAAAGRSSGLSLRALLHDTSPVQNTQTRPSAHSIAIPQAQRRATLWRHRERRRALACRQKMSSLLIGQWRRLSGRGGLSVLAECGVPGGCEAEAPSRFAARPPFPSGARLRLAPGGQLSNPEEELEDGCPRCAGGKMAAASVSAASESQFSVSSVFFGFRVGRDGSPGCLTFLVALDLASAALRGRRVPPGGCTCPPVQPCPPPLPPWARWPRRRLCGALSRPGRCAQACANRAAWSRERNGPARNT